MVFVAVCPFCCLILGDTVSGAHGALKPFFLCVFNPLGRFRFESTVDEERDALMKRRTALLDEARTDMSSVTARVSPLVPEINAKLEKYSQYPEEVNAVRDQLKNKKTQVITFGTTAAFA